MKRRRLIILPVALIFLYGCAAVWLGVGGIAGVGAYKYVEGNVIRDYPIAYARAWSTTNTALANLKIGVTKSVNEGTKGTIEAVQRNGSKITVKLKDKGQGVTSIAVRVGVLGDRKTAERIHGEIAAGGGI